MHTAAGPRRHAFATLLVMLAFTAVPAGQQKPQPPSVERAPGLAVDFMAVGADGTPIDNLTAADVTVRIDNRPRAIQSLRFVRVASAQPDAAADTLPPPYGTSGPAANTARGRTLVLIIDDDSFRAGNEKPIREAVNGLTAGLTPRDHIMLITMPYGGVKVPLTTDHAKVRSAVSGLMGQRPQSETGSEMACRTRRLLESLAGFLETVAGGTTPANVIFFTAGMAGPRRDAPAGLAPGMCELTIDQFRRVGAAAGASRANFYIVQPDDVSLSRGGPPISGDTAIGSDNPLEGIENLAGVTRGHRLPLTAVGQDALGRILRETSGHYVAEITPERSDLNGRTHGLNVRVERPDVTVRVRPEITFVSPRAPTPPTAAPTAHQMLLVSETFPELPMRAAGFTLDGGEGKVRVVAVAESSDPSVVLASAAAALIDTTGRVVAQWTASDAAEVPLAGAMLVDPGAYRLRVAATDTSGRAGTADYPIVAALTPAGPLKLSSLLLGLSRDGAVIPKLEFGSEPLAIGSFEIYGNPPGTSLTAALDVARTLDGPALVSIRLALERSGENRFVATGAVPLGALAPGDYVVRGTISVEGGSSARVVRTLRKRGR